MSAETNSHTMSNDEAVAQLQRRREIWHSKYAIRACYQKWVAMMKAHAREGRTLEIGGGAGLMKELWGEGLDCTDILPTPWIDFTLDALKMDVKESAYDNVICVDALHHLDDPHLFFERAAWAVRDGGKIIMVEPWITPLSRLGYALHHEPIWLKGYQHPDAARDDPWVGNLGMANVLFGRRERAQWKIRHPEWRIGTIRKFGFFDFQCAGGFKNWSIRPPWLYDLLLKLDDALMFAMPLIAFRVLIILERRPRS